MALFRRRLRACGTARRAVVWAPGGPGRSKSLDPQVAPGQALADQGRQAEGDGGRDLDRLQDHAVGEGVGGADPEPGVQDADHGELEDADVGGRRRHDGGHVDGEEDRGGGADAGLAVEVRREEERPAGARAGSPTR